MKRIARRGTNAFIKQMQLFAYGELYKKRFDKLGGTTDPQRLEYDWVATWRGVRKHSINSVHAILSNMDRHMRLKNGRIIPTRQRIDDALEKTARRLSWNKPVSDYDLPGHR